VQKSMKEFKGMMTPEHVAEGFYRLVTECENGSAMAIMPNIPYMLVPDYNVFPMIKSMALTSKFLGKLMEPRVVTANHHIMAFIIIFLFFFFYKRQVCVFQYFKLYMISHVVG